MDEIVFYCNALDKRYTSNIKIQIDNRKLGKNYESSYIYHCYGYLIDSTAIDLFFENRE